jgi:crotonobetainyl-CoA:carnitine CoA-transferase CaiB-like acyl-CoA transferase
LPRALDGVVVIDFGQIYSGSYCSMLLRQLGADVIKIEPFGGEPLRWRGALGQESQAFVMLNAGKRGLRLNLKASEGRSVLKRLASTADVLIENFAPGTMDRLGLGWDALRAWNDKLIVASGKGYGSSGPYRDYRAMDLTVQAMSGVLSATGFPGQQPVKSGAAFADFSGGVHLAAGVLAALYQRTHTGKGQFIEVSMHDSVLPTLTSNLAAYLDSAGAVPERTGNRHGGLAICPYNVYPASDGWVAVMCSSNRHWLTLCQLMDRGDLAADPRFASNPERARHMDEIDNIVALWTVTMTKAGLADRLVQADIPAGPVISIGELLDDPHIRERGMLQTVTQPGRGPMLTYGAPIRLSDSPPMPVRHAPGLGEHSREVLAERLGLTPAQVNELADAEVI